MQNKIFTGFLIILFSALLWLVPISGLVYGFQTDLRTDEFYITTTVATTNATVTLSKAIYDNDTATISVFSDLNTDLPVFVSHNSTTRATVFDGLSDNATRTLEVSYDYDALNSTTWATVLNLAPTLWMIIIIIFPLVVLVVLLVDKFRRK